MASEPWVTFSVLEEGHGTEQASTAHLCCALEGRSVVHRSLSSSSLVVQHGGSGICVSMVVPCSEVDSRSVCLSLPATLGMVECRSLSDFLLWCCPDLI